ncbi:MAG: aromatic ring-hydroxylating dioxygenase subunit alpha [Pseudomonadota bacterium]
MPYDHPIPAQPRQLLPRDAYTSQAWLDAEQTHLFSRCWTYAGVTADFPEPGSYRTLTAGPYPLIVMRNQDGALQAFHNLCRHRGTELLEGAGTLKGTIVCPYHRWTYGTDGSLRGVPNEAECFAGIDKSALGLKPAAIGVFKGLVFVHPDPEPEMDFTTYLGSVPDVAWPHDIEDGSLVAGDEAIYEMKCNWKVFYENAIDGYHLAYLHDKTLGPVGPDKNIWDAHRQHLVWYSTERDGARSPLTKLVEDQFKRMGVTDTLPDGMTPYGGVYMLFPTTIITAVPYSLSVAQLVPISPGVTHLKARTFSPPAFQGRYGKVSDIPGYDPVTGLISSDNWETHPLETYDFQTEDVWVCEKMQRSLTSPAYEVGPLAAGAGAESSLMHFQQSILDYVPAP